MAHYDITYTCGCKGTVNLIGPHHSRERRIAQLEQGDCFDCYKNRRTEISSKQAEELELPPLTGSEKQIAWAESLRIQKLKEIEEEVEQFEDKDHEEYRQILMAVEMISNVTSAKKWIDWRNDDPRWVIYSTVKSMKAEPTEEQKRAKQEEKERSVSIQRAAMAEATLRPVKSSTEFAAEIAIKGDTIFVAFPEEHEAFKEIVKSLRYGWENRQWQRSVGKLAGTALDRAIELGHVLLSHGFPVRVFDEAMRQRIAEGVFVPEQTRWITKLIGGSYFGWFAIRWGLCEDYYAAAQRLPGSRYSRPCVVVPPEQFDQVLDFAQMYDFRLSPGAQELVRQAQEEREKMLVVSKDPLVSAPKTIVSHIPPVMAIPESIEVVDDLRDDE